MQRAAIYTRISMDKTGQQAGVERQLASCRELADRLGWQVVATFTDNDLSAYSGKPRPEFEKMLAAMKRGEFGAVVASDSDRLYRNMRDLERLIDIAEAERVFVKTVNSGELDLSTSAGRLNARILGSVARQESEHHGERRREANKTKAIAGQWRGEGTRPFGYDKTGVPQEPEAGLITQAIKDILSGKSLHSIARSWNESGVTTVRGVSWTNLHVRRVLTNPRIAGLRVHQGEIVGTGLWEPIVDATIWRGVCALLADSSRRNAVAFERKYMLSGIAKCGVSGCGRCLYAAYPHGRNRAMIYTCRPTGHLGRNGAALDDFVERIVVGYLEQNGIGRDLRDAENNVDAEALRTERDALAATKGQLATLLRKRHLDMADVERESAILTAQIADIDKQLVETAVGTHPVAALLTDGDEEIDPEDTEKLIERWKKADPDRKSKIVAYLFDVIVNPARPGQRVFDPHLIDIHWHQKTSKDSALV